MGQKMGPHMRPWAVIRTRVHEPLSEGTTKAGLQSWGGGQSERREASNDRAKRGSKQLGGLGGGGGGGSVTPTPPPQRGPGRCP